MNRSFALSLSFLLAAASARAQGSDSCATPQPIAGTGTFAFDTTAASTGAEGQNEPACSFFGQIGIANDVWFEWTAPSTGTAEVATCSQTTVDSKIAVYAGSGCPTAAALACNDDLCGLQTRLTFSCVQGGLYAIQLGNYPGATTQPGTGTMTIAIQGPPTVLATMVNPANGHTYHFLTASSWTAAEGAAIALGGHLATVDDQAEQDWIVANFHSFQGVPRDVWIGLNDAASEGNFVWSSGDPVAFTAWDLNEPSNANGIEDYAAVRKNSASGLWNDLADNPTGFHANAQGLVEVGSNAIEALCFGDGTQSMPCPCANSGAPGQGCDNSAATGGALLQAAGTTAPDTVVLTSSNELATALSIFLQGDQQLATPAVFGDGLRCVGGSLKRLYVENAVGGTASAPGAGDPPVTQQSANLGDPIAPGSMRWYQVYYRDPNLGFCPSPPGNSWNVSNGLRITW